MKWDPKEPRPHKEPRWSSLGERPPLTSCSVLSPWSPQNCAPPSSCCTQMQGFGVLTRRTVAGHTQEAHCPPCAVTCLPARLTPTMQPCAAAGSDHSQVWAVLEAGVQVGWRMCPAHPPGPSARHSPGNTWELGFMPWGKASVRVVPSWETGVVDDSAASFQAGRAGGGKGGQGAWKAGGQHQVGLTPGFPWAAWPGSLPAKGNTICLLRLRSPLSIYREDALEAEIRGCTQLSVMGREGTEQNGAAALPWEATGFGTGGARTCSQAWSQPFSPNRSPRHRGAQGPRVRHSFYRWGP